MNWQVMWIMLVVIGFLLVLGVFLSLQSNKRLAIVLSTVYTCAIASVPIMLVFVYLSDPNQIDVTVITLCVALDLFVLGFAAYASCTARQRRLKKPSRVCDYVWIAVSLLAYTTALGYRRAQPGGDIQLFVLTLLALLSMVVFVTYSARVVGREVRTRRWGCFYLALYGAIFSSFTIVISVNPVYDALFVVDVIFLAACGVIVLDCMYYVCGLAAMHNNA